MLLTFTQDTRKTNNDDSDSDSDSDSDDDEEPFDLSTAYSLLSAQLWKAKGVRELCLISGLLELMLRTKVSITFELIQTCLT